MSYRVDPKTGLIECDGADEALALASMISQNETRSHPQRPVVRSASAVIDFRSFVKGLKPSAKKVLSFMLEQHDPDAASLEKLKLVLATEDGKVVGGTIAGITKSARKLGIGDVVLKDENTGIYTISTTFRDAYERAGKPKIQ